MRLGTKLSIYITSFLFIAICVFAVTTAEVRIREISDDLLVKDIIISSNVTQDITDYFATYYFTQFSEFTAFVGSRFEKYPELKHIRVININGTILFDSTELKDGRYDQFEDRRVTDEVLLDKIKDVKESYEFTTVDNKKVIQVIYPYIDTAGRHLSSTEFTFSLERINSEVNRIIKLFLVISAVFLGISYISTIFFSKILIKSISELKEGADQISKGNLDYRIKVTSKDEIGTLANAFNQMAQDIKNSNIEREAYNKRLEKDVADRTKELDIRVDELERLQKLSVDRELKMIELKEQIRKLNGETISQQSQS